MANLNSPRTLRMFWQKVDKGQTCWNWTGGTFKNGYGIFGGSRAGGTRKAHRISWTIANGPIPLGLFVCHKCDNKLCVRPSHLFLGSPRDNQIDCVQKGRHADRRGENSGTSKLKWRDVRSIRRSAQRSVDLAATYAVSQATICMVRKRVTWKES